MLAKLPGEFHFPSGVMICATGGPGPPRGELFVPPSPDLLARACYGPARVLGDPERTSAAGGLHAVGTGVSGPYRHHLRSLSETVGFEVCGVAGVRVPVHVVELLRRRRHTQLCHGCGVLRLVLLADVVRYRDGGQYPYDNDDRIVTKSQTQENLGFVRCS